ncbi:hypothetical protein KXR64_02985 [Brucella intermedia]|uniref:glycosyltransferase n=1 Tax=Brucella TaxID=234 RepID=UPI00094634C0|nr:glycosyltransferase [Brucella intermedia]
MSNPKRAMWLMNHSTLRKFEVPLLESLGYEVYLPKIFPYDEGNLSASIDYSRDGNLSIPKENLEALNNHDFYSGMTPEIGEVASKYFDIAFFGFFPDQLAGLVRHFRNTIIMRPFGLSAGDCYTNITAATLGPSFMHELEERRKDFWFGQAYDHLANVESGIFRDRAITLPLGIDDAVIRNEWTGTDSKVLFVCPRIGSSPYFNRIYKNFLKDFGEFPYIIGGAQPIAVEDPNVKGFLSREEYDSMMRETRVMYYHSREERHLHYHPIEAVRWGMPLVFMAGGLLDKLGGKNLPGRCKTESEAKDKIRRILNGDNNLVARIKETQGALLKEMSRDFCEPVWRQNFQIIEPTIQRTTKQPVRTSDGATKKIAVFLPEPYKGGTLNMVKLLAKMLKKGSELAGKNYSVVFAHPDDDIYSDGDFVDLKPHGIEVRSFKWKTISDYQLQEVFSCTGYEIPVPGGLFCLPKDNTTDFLDCDFWLVGSDRFYHPIAPLRPYCLFTHDYLQRYFPESVSPDYEMSYLIAARNAIAVLANTPHTINDVINYVGVPSKKAILVPHVSELDQFRKNDDPVEKQDYFIWTTNAAPHKNHKMTFEALNRYFGQLKGSFNCHITGVGSDKFDPEREFDDLPKYIKECRDYLKKNPSLYEHLKFLGNVSSEEYVHQMKGAKFLLHNVIMDNGTLCAIEAAFALTPTLSSDYPPMRYLSDRYGINAQFFDPFNNRELGDALKSMELNWQDHQKQLPDKQALLDFGWQKMSPIFFEKLHTYIG